MNHVSLSSANFTEGTQPAGVFVPAMMLPMTLLSVVTSGVTTAYKPGSACVAGSLLTRCANPVITLHICGGE